MRWDHDLRLASRSLLRPAGTALRLHGLVAHSLVPSGAQVHRPDAPIKLRSVISTVSSKWKITLSYFSTSWLAD